MFPFFKEIFEMTKQKLKNRIYLVVFIAIVLITVFASNAYKRIYKSNVNKTAFLYIPSGSDYNDVISILKSDSLLIDLKSFQWLAQKKNYPNHIYPGRYKLDSGMNNTNIINRLRSGYQEPVRVVFNSVRTFEQLAGKISKQIEADSVSLLATFRNDSIVSDYGFKPETFSSMFIPNTYEFWWNTTAKSFVARMGKEYKIFWNSDRLEKAKKLNLTPEEVTTLASIVDEETYFNNEMPRVAGVYINRLKKRMHLQADPTLKFAWGDFSIKRVLNTHKQIDSPYNTYKRYGLPPGPISIPSTAAIDAVLNYEKHSYLYFCAKPDFSGYHNFAKTLSQHNINAREYQRALNKERIWR